MNKKKLHVIILKKKPILELIQNTQELDPQCRRISRQLRDLVSPDPSLALVTHYSEDDVLREDGRVLVPPQEAIRSQLLEVFHDSPSGGH